jgi:2-keto-4-pentenoate hydratase/2-oxohepta-3-ene-1,7-dioic acid hydratase in catechol pathway
MYEQEMAGRGMLKFTRDGVCRKWQGKKGGGQWARAKSFDTFLPLGEHASSVAWETWHVNRCTGTRVNLNPKP